MKLNKVDLLNKGMSQDLSISKEVLEYAFENKNIRLQAMDDGTLMTITNVRGPKKIFDAVIKGAIIGKCFTGEYLVLFTVEDTGDAYTKGNSLCRIYRIDLNKRISGIKVNLLYENTDLCFDKNRTFDTLFYYENKNIQKVYWTESWYTDEELKNKKAANPGKTIQNNVPRVINIITEGEIEGRGFTQYTSNKFDFYPSSSKVPKFEINKDYNMISELPSGIIQYYITYYFENGAETLIANNSDSFTIDYENRGAEADESGMCGFKLTISNIDTKFDYFRVYSAIRTTKDGPLLVKIVSDVKIVKTNTNPEYVVVDTGINQEVLDPSLLFYIGGTPLYAKTIEQKDNTLFLGNIKTSVIDVPKAIEDLIDTRKYYVYKVNINGKEEEIYFIKSIDGKIYVSSASYSKLTGIDVGLGSELYVVPDTILKKYNIDINNTLNLVKVVANDVKFTQSTAISLELNSFSSYYNYKLLTVNGESSYKTFKAGEVYRFGILFLNKFGQWSSVVWVGDRECTKYPIVDNDNHQILLNNAVYTFPTVLLAECKKAGFINYRIVIADAESSNGRRIKAQGVVCPTLFSPGQRAMGLHSISSWVMRPRGGDCAYHHFEPLTSTFASKGAEIYGYDIGEIDDGSGTMTSPTAGKPKFSCGGTWYTSPFYGITIPSGYENSPRYLVTQISIHSGHKLAIKATEVASDFGETNFYNSTNGDYDYTPIHQYDETFNYGLKGWEKINETLVLLYAEYDWPINQVLTANTMKKIAQKQGWNEFFTIAFLASSIYHTFGIVANAAGKIHLFGLATKKIKRDLKEKYLSTCKKEWLREIVDKDYTLLDTNAKNQEKSGNEVFGYGEDYLPKEFASKGLNAGQWDFDNAEWGVWGAINAVHFVNITPLTDRSYLNSEIDGEWNRFYVDESIVTFHSPEIDSCRDSNLKFRIVGTAPINSFYSNAEIQTSTSPYIMGGGLSVKELNKYRVTDTSNSNLLGLYSDYIYWDSLIDSVSGLSSYNVDCLNEHYYTTKAANYKVYLWDKSFSGASITGGTKDMKELTSAGPTIGTVPSIIKDKTFFNQINSFCNNYFDKPLEYDISKVKLFDGHNDRVFIEQKDLTSQYAGNYDHLITLERACNIHVEDHTKVVVSPFTAGSVRIKYNSTPHVVFDLSNKEDNLKSLLPRFDGEIPYKIGNYKDTSTHTWVERDVPPFKAIDSCWAYDIEPYIDDSTYFVATMSLIKEPDGSYYYEKDYSSSPAYPDISGISKEDNLIITKMLEEGKEVHIGVMRCYYHEWDDSIKLFIYNKLFMKKNVDQLVWYGGYKSSTRLINAVRVVTNPVCVYYDLYKVIDFKTDSAGNVTYSYYEDIGKTNPNKVYVLKNSLSHGRFRWKSTSDKRNKFDKCIERVTDFNIKYELPVIALNEKIDSKYLFIGELYLDIPESELYGGYGKQQLLNLQWYPVSSTTPIGNNVTNTFGDTYYQRYDCLKTYPSTEEDINKVVDITSFMVESHKNLDMRTDQNRDFYNMMTRPTNFNKFNSVYDNTSNIFQYTTKISDYVTNEYSNQLVWSLTKNFLGRVDTWTGINTLSFANCGSAITKLKNYQNTLISLNENEVELINYNNKNFISTESDFIEIANNLKVDGTTKLYNVYGTTNNTTLITEKGLYFIDDKEKSIIRLSTDNSITKLGMSKMDSWLKNNIALGSYTFYNINPFYLEYDPVHKDVYIMNEDVCLIYNEQMESFTSFMEYPKCYTLFPIDGQLMALATQNYKTYSIYQMFDGLYNTTFDLLPIGYSVNYRINPSPYNDKVFTNVEFIADCADDTGLINELPFDDIQVWNEYLDTGILSLNYQKNYISNLKKKFRIWRADIPRDKGKSLRGDRIRNPWINMKLKKNPTLLNYKLELHNMNVQYMM